MHVVIIHVLNVKKNNELSLGNEFGQNRNRAQIFRHLDLELQRYMQMYQLAWFVISVGFVLKFDSDRIGR